MKHAKDNSNLKVVSGQVLKAELWNRVIDRLPNNDAATGTSVSQINTNVVQCEAHKNIDFPEVYAVSDYEGIDNDVYEIAPSHVLSTKQMLWPVECHKLVVSTRPVRDEELGPFTYNGGAIVEVTNGSSNPSGDHAFPDPDDTTKMKICSSGYRILNRVGDDWAVVDLANPQPLWLYELTESYAGGPTAQANILDLYSQQFSTTPTTIYYEGDCKPTNLPEGHVGYAMFADGLFYAIDQCGESSGGQERKRIRFVLRNKFNDTGAAVAEVLDSFGNTGLVRGDQVNVFDPRKLFAHAIGYQNINITPNAAFPCGGSIGYAVWTEAPDIDPPSEADYPRYEVEQCTQTVEKMKVFVYESGSGSGATPKSRPTGAESNEEEECVLYFANAENFMSRWPDVDYCESWVDKTDPNVPAPYEYQLIAKNPHRFSAKRGSWCYVEKTTTPQRPEDHCNDMAPYNGFGDPAPEWSIVEVEKPLARWIRVEWDYANQEWKYGSDYAEGEDPSAGYFPDDEELKDHIRTAVGLQEGCLQDGEYGWAFWDPNDQFYNVIVTNSALYGSPIDATVIGKLETTDNPLTVSGCSVDYTKVENIKLFGISAESNNECEATQTPVNYNIGTQAVNVVTGFTYDPEHPYLYCPTTAVVYVCGTGPGQPIDCIDVCTPCEDPAETGCCELSNGTYVPDQTLDQCNQQGGNWLGPNTDCPEPCLIECEECNNGGARFQLDGLKWDGNGTTSGFGGGADNATAQWAAGQDDCCATLSVTLKSDDPNVNAVPATATVCIVQPNNCPTSQLELELSWQPQTFDGVTLPTALGAGQTLGCGGTYGKTGGCIVPANPDPNNMPPQGSWDEADITVTDCDPFGGQQP